MAFQLAADAVELLAQHQAVWWSFIRILFQQAANQIVDLERDFRINPAGRIELAIAVFMQQIEIRSAGERRLSGQQRVEHDTETIQIAAFADRFAGGLLGRQELRSANHSPRGRQVLAGENLGDAEIGQLDDALVGPHNVGGLDIAMDDAVIVDVAEGGANLQGNFEHLGPGKRPWAMRISSRLWPSIYSIA